MDRVSLDTVLLAAIAVMLLLALVSDSIGF